MLKVISAAHADHATNNAAKLKRFTAEARFYACLAREISRDMRDLNALRAAYTYMTEHTGREAEDLKDAIESLEECIVLNLHVNGYGVNHD
jgi:hypothetical protein